MTYTVHPCALSSEASVFEKFPLSNGLSNCQHKVRDEMITFLSQSPKLGSTSRDLQLKKVNMNCPHPPRLPLKFNNREHSRVQSAGRKKLKPALFEKLHTFSRYKVNRISLRCWLEKWLSRGANDRLLRSVDFCIH